MAAGRCGLTTAHCQMQRDRHFAHLLRRFLRFVRRARRRKATDADDDSDGSELPRPASCLARPPARPCQSTPRRCWGDIRTNVVAALTQRAQWGGGRAGGLKSQAGLILSGRAAVFNASASAFDNNSNKQPYPGGRKRDVARRNGLPYRRTISSFALPRSQVWGTKGICSDFGFISGTKYCGQNVFELWSNNG